MITAVTRPVRDRQTYRNLAYLALALPLGLVELLFLVVGFALALVLLVTLLGVAVAARTVDGAFALAHLERRLTTRLLRTQIPVALPAAPPPGAGAPTRLRVQLCCPTTWQRLAYLAARLPLAGASFALTGAALALSGWLIAAPLHESGAAAVGLTLAGALALPAALHLANALARMWARIGVVLLPAA
jgi:Putative sensor